jgi:hypothetical protein
MRHTSIIFVGPISVAKNFTTVDRNGMSCGRWNSWKGLKKKIEFGTLCELNRSNTIQFFIAFFVGMDTQYK